ncbi:MAG: glycosyltransferase family 2 protein [Acidimicrobiales bacterium]
MTLAATDPAAVAGRVRPTVDVAMVAFGNVDRIEQRVRGLRSYGVDGRVIVVDHGDDGSGAAAARAGATILHDPTNPGFGAGINRAVAASTAEYVLLMNPDADLTRIAIAAGLEALAADPSAGAAQGLIRTEATGDLERSGGRELRPIDLLGRALGAKRLLSVGFVARLARSLGAAHQVDRGTDAVVAVETIAATAMLIRREAFDSIGGFDERYFLYGEDLDLCRRLRAAGWTLLYLPTPWAEHECGGSAANWWERELRWWEGTLQFAAQWWGTGAFARAVGAAALMTVRLSIASPRRAGLAARALLRSPLATRGESNRGVRPASTRR